MVATPIVAVRGKAALRMTLHTAIGATVKQCGGMREQVDSGCTCRSVWCMWMRTTLYSKICFCWRTRRRHGGADRRHEPQKRVNT